MIITEIKVKGDSGKVYTVTAGAGAPTCTCLDFVFRHADVDDDGCKHIKFAAASLLIAV